MAPWRYEISLLVLKKYFTRSLRSLEKYFSTLEEKFRISARPCNILLYLFSYLELLLVFFFLHPLTEGKPTKYKVLGHTFIITKENEDTPAELAGSNRGEREGIYICVERQLKLKLSRNRLN